MSRLHSLDPAFQQIFPGPNKESQKTLAEPRASVVAALNHQGYPEKSRGPHINGIQKKELFTYFDGIFSTPLERYKRPEDIRIEDLKEALEANPEAMHAVYWMYAEGGQPDVLLDENDAFTICDHVK